MSTVFITKKLLNSNLATDRKSYIYLHSEWIEQNLKLHIKDSSSGLCYAGEMEGSEFKEASEDLEIPLQKYIDDLKCVLTTELGLPGFEVELDTQNKLLVVNKRENFCAQHVEMKLRTAAKDYEMLNVAIELIEAEKVNNKNNECDNSVEEKIQFMQKQLHEKEEWKQLTYKKFLLILNEKKLEINKLKSDLENSEREKRRAIKALCENRKDAEMDMQDSDHESTSNTTASSHENSVYDAPTQRLTPPPT
ncbi:uncharacterized protein LOC105665331 [Ceratitis capitata]|uniref:(Mediterranean fruit fly) hypothetical protein n=1 Tax=Ceratitis capitata TaxID=7213 RepID=W8C2Z6_CERCA|nr:uncharacterized protein LOC105665331 [Ceratitis capitata]CAD7002914.1 unnamed protein product [Ceratitis capitata]